MQVFIYIICIYIYYCLPIGTCQGKTDVGIVFNSVKQSIVLMQIYFIPYLDTKEVENFRVYENEVKTLQAKKRIFPFHKMGIFTI